MLRRRGRKRGWRGCMLIGNSVRYIRNQSSKYVLVTVSRLALLLLIWRALLSMFSGKNLLFRKRLVFQRLIMTGIRISGFSSHRASRKYTVTLIEFVKLKTLPQNGTKLSTTTATQYSTYPSSTSASKSSTWNTQVSTAAPVNVN